MKSILIALFACIHLIGLSQAKLSMSKRYQLSPAAAANPTVGVNFGDSVSLSVSVKNTGNVLFSGNIIVSAQRDTTAGQSCGTASLAGVSIAPGDSVLAVLSFTPTSGPTNFQVNGNGNTIVVWPVASVSVLYGDSVRPIVWMSPYAGVNDHYKNLFNLYPNPTNGLLNISTSGTEIYRSVTIFNYLAQKVVELPYNQTINLSELKPGYYWIIIATDEKKYKLRFVKQ